MFGKFFPLVVALLGLLSIAVEAGPAADKCRRKNPDVYNLINSFCNRGNIISPGGYAQSGAYSEGYMSHIWISSGMCFRPQWIPSYYCRTQFMRTCADGGPYGGTKPVGRPFGKGNCQYYHIDPHAHWNLSKREAAELPAPAEQAE